MRWIAVFTDTPEMTAVRREREPLHLAYLREHRDEIVLAGGCRDEPGGAYVGGLWVLEAPSRQRVIELIEGDPYYVPSVRRFRIHTWGKALPDVAVTL